MDWFSFVAGALTGWIVEWLVDLFYWRRRQSRWANEQNRLQADFSHAQNTVTALQTREIDLSQQMSMSRGDLDAANNNIGVLQGELDEARSQIEALNNQIALADSSRQALADQVHAELDASEAEAAALRGQLEGALADIRALHAENSTLRANKDELEIDVARFAAVGGLTAAAVAAGQSPNPTGDDLTIIEGIGPKIAELLNQNGIHTFSQLADTGVPDLETILRAGGSRFQTASPDSWPRQARLAANREWPRLDALKAQLQGGVRRTRGETAPEPQDDLAVLEGIGPKIAEILYRNGIRTFAQLARAEPARLRLILDEAGPAYRIADPTNWPEQASWAAVGNWDRLQALKDQLDAGRRLE
jgi:predicted flap endonuclease-1-like 5' DNA nuclease